MGRVWKGTLVDFFNQLSTVAIFVDDEILFEWAHWYCNTI